MARRLKPLTRILIAAGILAGLSACYYNDKPYFGDQRHNKKFVPAEVRAEPVFD